MLNSSEQKLQLCIKKCWKIKIVLTLKLPDAVFTLLINVKLPTIVGILTFMSRIMNFMLQLSWEWKQFYNLGDCFTGDRLSISSLLESHKECLAVETQAVDSFLTESPLHLAISQVHSVTGKEFFSMRQWPFIIQNQCDILKTNVTFSNSNVTYPKITRICKQL